MGKNIYKIFPQFLVTCLILFRIRPLRVQGGPCFAPLLALGAVTLLSASSSLHPYESLWQGGRMLLSAAFYLAIVNLPWDDRRYRRMLIAGVAGIWVLAVRVAVARLMGMEFRAGEFHGHPNNLAAICVTVLPIVLFFTHRPAVRWRRAVLGATGVVIAGVLALTLSRAAYLGLFAALGFLAVTGKRRARRALIPVAAGLVLLLAVAWKPLLVRLMETVPDLAGSRPESRLVIWDRSFRAAFPGMPLTGWGANKGFTQVVASREAVSDESPPLALLAHPHDQFLDILTGTGLPGLVAWTWLAVAFIGAVRGSRNADVGEAAPYLFAAGIALLVIAGVESVFTNRNVFPAIVWLLALPSILPRLGTGDVVRADQ